MKPCDLLAGFPEEVINKMLERQEEQGNPRDMNVFDLNDAFASKFSGGFTWDETPEGHSFWCDVIEDRNFDLFFQLYPKNQL